MSLSDVLIDVKNLSGNTKEITLLSVIAQFRTLFEALCLSSLFLSNLSTFVTLKHFWRDVLRKEPSCGLDVSVKLSTTPTLDTQRNQNTTNF